MNSDENISDPLNDLETSDEWEREPGENTSEAEDYGFSYVSSRAQAVAGKLYQNFDCECKSRCAENAPEATRRDIFNTFLKLNNCSEQNVFLCDLIVRQKTLTRNPQDSFRNAKSVMNSFRFQVIGNSVILCKRFSQKILALDVCQEQNNPYNAIHHTIGGLLQV
ncbi:hypothetical protein HHI36_011364 [Cryptolaemus montrouzieri]|uniref:Uncharacterized protein n=1 Tax=Cryptolaemus montrouzieri TaxID=559131 RepID=A0ABD2MLL6_9CUCU